MDSMVERDGKGRFAKGHKGRRDDESALWKGDGAGYGAKHAWVYLRLGKPRMCEHCKKTNLRHRQYHWANISRLYKRDIRDWKRLCIRCHRKFDMTPSLRKTLHENGCKRRKLTAEEIKNIKSSFLKGERQAHIAHRFKVNQSTISLIVNGKTYL